MTGNHHRHYRNPYQDEDQDNYNEDGINVIIMDTTGNDNDGESYYHHNIDNNEDEYYDSRLIHHHQDQDSIQHHHHNIIEDTLSDINIQNNNEYSNNNSNNNNNTNNESNNSNGKRVPIWCWIILVAALLAMSSSGAALTMIDAPSLRKASWRLQSTSIILFFGFLFDMHTLYPRTNFKLSKWLASIVTSSSFVMSKLPPTMVKQLEIASQEPLSSIQELKSKSESVRTQYITKKTILLLFATGIVLGLHFGFWVSSLSQTSLSHSLLFVTSSPIMVVIVMLVTRKPISKGEIIGCVIGFIGLIVTLFDSLFLDTVIDSTTGHNPTLFGDLLALLGAVCIVFYLFVGSNLRTWMPLYLYVFPVTCIAAIFLTIVSLIFEHPEYVPDQPYPGVVGWFQPSFILLTLYVAIFPGIIGHTGVNVIIKYIEPVVISVTLLLEPPIGTVMGWIVGVSGIPGMFTFIGAPIVMGGCFLVTISSYKRSKQELDGSNNSNGKISTGDTYNLDNNNIGNGEGDSGGQHNTNNNNNIELQSYSKEIEKQELIER